MPSEIAAKLLCMGARTREEIEVRRGGAGPAGGAYLILEDRVVNVPLIGRYIERSPYLLIRKDGDLVLIDEDEGIERKVELVERPRFYDLRTSDGIEMWRIALRHGRDCLASTVIQRCFRFRDGTHCRFCGIEISLRLGRTVAIKKPGQLAEVLEASLEDGVRHVTLTTGSTRGPGRGGYYLARVVEEMKNRVPEIPIHVQIEPPEDLGVIERLYEAGADTIGIHIETTDEDVAKRICPGKIDRRIFERAWRISLDNFGENQVSTFLIVGLGEDSGKIEEGVEWIAQQGVLPFPVPLRPIPSTEMGDLSPPDWRYYLRICEISEDACSSYGLRYSKNRAGCVRCGACSAVGD